MYKVKITIYPKALWGDSVNGEYTGIAHRTRKDAENELRKAQADRDISEAWIEEC